MRIKGRPDMEVTYVYAELKTPHEGEAAERRLQQAYDILFEKVEKR